MTIDMSNLSEVECKKVQQLRNLGWEIKNGMWFNPKFQFQGLNHLFTFEQAFERQFGMK